MNGYVDNYGALFLKRGGEFKVMKCPFSSGEEGGLWAGPSVCGDGCPLFGEPTPVGTNGGIELRLCKRVLVFGRGGFEDRR